MGYYGDMAEDIRQSAEEERKRKAKLTQLQGGDQLRDMTLSGLQSVQGRTAPQAGMTQVGQVATGTGARLAVGPQTQFRDLQMGTANRLQSIASGQTAGAGELAAQRQGNRAVAQQQAMARMGRGADAAMAARTASRNAGNIGLATAGQAQQAAMGDQQMANQTLAGLAAQGRGQDIDIASQNAQLKQSMNLANLSAQNQKVFQQAGLDQATSLANMQSKLQTMGMNDQASLAYLSQLFGVDAAEMQARLQLEVAKMQADAQKGSKIGDIMTVGGQLGAAYLGRPGG